MTWPLAAKIRYVDETLCWLVDYRRRCDDPGEALRICWAIDNWLDDRLGLVRRAEREGLAYPGRAADSVSPSAGPAPRS